MKVLDGFGLDGTDPLAHGGQPAVLPTDVEKPVPVGTGMKRSRDCDLGDRSGELDTNVGSFSDAPQAKKKKKSKKKKSS